MDQYVRFGNKMLRKGYTTGTTAAAAAKAATLVLLGEKPMKYIEVELPDGIKARLEIKSLEQRKDSCRCVIIKDGGDDPDITTGLEIVAEVTLSSEKGVKVDGGLGVGKVTQRGLKVEVGKAAINPVPMNMIKANVQSVLPQEKGAAVMISVPEGERIAHKTFNPKLGIVGGISILGSTGIVNPMSEDSLKESIALELNILREKGYENIIYAFGNYGLDFLRSQGIDDVCVIKISNYIGFMLDKALDAGVRKILLSGHIGKLIKVAGGIFNTHSRMADCRLEILTAYAGLEGADKAVLTDIYNCKTTAAALEIVEAQGLQGIYKRIGDNVTKRSGAYTYGEIEVGTVLFGEGNRLLYMDDNAKVFLEENKSNGN
ncbi:MAG: cobalt-precorrin-5B (C(1))-methyltransferase CbiD [Bacillota bacterium]|nr:cobalt-precorrin-5B (C(1))-methyltransferase CbiD [Bacillota bacterium]